MSETKAPDQARHYEVAEKDLPLYCPLPSAPLWARHPRVFLDVVKTGEAICPYCSNHFVYKGEPPKGHH